MVLGFGAAHETLGDVDKIFMKEFDAAVAVLFGEIKLALKGMPGITPSQGHGTDG